MFYVLLILCLTAAFVSGICHLSVFGLVMACVVLGWVSERRHWVYPKVFRGIGIALFLGLCVIHIIRAEGLQAWVLGLVFSGVWAFLGYRALRHETTGDKVQGCILTVLPVAYMAFRWSVVPLICFLWVYLPLFFGCLLRLSLAVPTTGSVAYSAQVLPRTRWYASPWVKGCFLSVLAVGLGFCLFLVMPKWGMEASGQNAEFPDVSMLKTGKIERDSALIFRAEVPLSAEPLYWRVEVQDVFDGRQWHAIRGHHALSGMLVKDGYRLEFVRRWQDTRLPTLSGTTGIWHLPELEGFGGVFTDGAHAWHLSQPQGVAGFIYAMDSASLAEGRGANAFVADIQGNAWDRNVAYHEREAGKIRVYRHIQPEPWQRFVIAMRSEDKRPYSEVAWRLIQRLNAGEMPLSVPQTQDKTRMASSKIWLGDDEGAANRLKTLALSIVEGVTGNTEKAERIQAYLRAHYRYSLERPERVGAPVMHFLFEHRVGHCEMFSTAMAVLLSSVGVPVRNVSGFVSDEYHGAWHYVRSAHAHSWVEIYEDTTHRWVRFDPTPSGATGYEVSLLARLDDWFVTYDRRDLSTWLRLYGLQLALILASLVALGLLLRVPVRFVRRRLLPPSEVWDGVWREFQESCRSNPSTSSWAERSLDAWWQVSEDDAVTSFVRAYIEARYGRHGAEPQGIWQHCVHNHRVIRLKSEAVRALKRVK